MTLVTVLGLFGRSAWGMPSESLESFESDGRFESLQAIPFQEIRDAEARKRGLSPLQAEDLVWEGNRLEVADRLIEIEADDPFERLMRVGPGQELVFRNCWIIRWFALGGMECNNGRLRFENCILSFYRNAVEVEGDSSIVELISCETNMAKVAVQQSGGQLILRDCLFLTHKSAIQASGNTVVDVSQCSFQGNGESILLQDEASCTIHASDFLGGRTSHIVLEGTGSASASMSYMSPVIPHGMQEANMSAMLAGPQFPLKEFVCTLSISYGSHEFECRPIDRTIEGFPIYRLYRREVQRSVRPDVWPEEHFDRDIPMNATQIRIDPDLPFVRYRGFLDAFPGEIESLTNTARNTNTE